MTRGEVLPGCDSIGPLERQRSVISLAVLRNQVDEGAGAGQTAHERAGAARVADEVWVAVKRGGGAGVGRGADEQGGRSPLSCSFLPRSRERDSATA